MIGHKGCKDKEDWCAYDPDCGTKDVQISCPKHCNSCVGNWQLTLYYGVKSKWHHKWLLVTHGTSYITESCVDLAEFCQYKPDCKIDQVESQCPKLCGVCGNGN